MASCAPTPASTSRMSKWAVPPFCRSTRTGRRDGLRARTGATVGVVVSDTFGRTWRRGSTDVAIGVAGVAAVVDLRGTTDGRGRVLVGTEICVADELAGA